MHGPAVRDPGHMAFAQTERLRRLWDPPRRGCRWRVKTPSRLEAAAVEVGRSERVHPEDWSRPWRSSCSTPCRARSAAGRSPLPEDQPRITAACTSASLARGSDESRFATDSPEQFAALERELSHFDNDAGWEPECAQPSDGSAARPHLACINHISVEDMKMVRRAFDQFDVDKDGVLTEEEFEQAVAQLLGSSYVDSTALRTASREAWRDAERNRDGSVDLGEFLVWYCLNGFSEDLLLTDTQKYLRRIARKCHVTVGAVDRVKYYFDMYDSDHSGVIEFEEFRQIVHKLMKVPEDQVLPISRVKYFWSELDADHSGCVEFEEFMSWWLSNFEESGEAAENKLPFEKFYGQIRKVNFHHRN